MFPGRIPLNCMDASGKNNNLPLENGMVSPDS